MPNLTKRNLARFPAEFMFELTSEEFTALRSQFATSNAPGGRGGQRYLPRAFTEHGAIMAASVLNSPRAVEVSVYVVRAFVRPARVKLLGRPCNSAATRMNAGSAG